MEVRKIKFEDIEEKKWNSCIHYAPNGNLFGYYWYLKNTLRSWDAWVEGDYQSVLPIPNEDSALDIRSSGILRENGLYSMNILSIPRQKAFLQTLEKNTVQLPLNERMNALPNLGWKFKENLNHQIWCGRPYEEIADKYNPEVGLALKKEIPKDWRLDTNIKIEQLVQTLKASQANVPEHALMRVAYNAMHRGIGTGFQVKDAQENIKAVAFMIFSHGKSIMLAASYTELQAFQYMVDVILRSNADKPMIVDFNQSYPALALSFGAQENIFYTLEPTSSKL